MEDMDNLFFTVPYSFFHFFSNVKKVSCSYTDLAQKITASIQPGTIKKIAGDLGLSFVPVKEKEGEVCFINSEEVRPEFRLSFAPVDIADYIFGAYQKLLQQSHLQQSPDSALLKIPYPTDAADFWELVKAGERLR